MIKYFYFILIVFATSYPKGVKILFDSKSTISYVGSHPAHDWTGISNNLKGGIVCDDNSFNQCFIKIVVPLKSFDSKNSGRDSNMLLYTESNKYPYVKFISDQFSVANLLTQDFRLYGELDFHGIKKKISTNVTLSIQEDMVLGTADLVLSLEDYNIDRPELLFIPISDEIKISCKLLCNNDLGIFQDEKR